MEQKSILLPMNIYEIFLRQLYRISLSRTDHQASKLRENKNFFHGLPPGDRIGSLFFVGASPSANSGNVEHHPRLSIGLWLVPIPTPPSQGNAPGTLAPYRPYAEGTHGGPLGEKQASDWFRYQRPCIQSTLDRIQQWEPLIHCFPYSNSPLGMVDILRPRRLKSQSWLPPLLGSQSGVQRIPFLDL